MGKLDKIMGKAGVALGGATGLLQNATKAAQIKDTSEEQSYIDTLNNAQLNLNSYDTMQQLWDQTQFAGTSYDMGDVRGMTNGQKAGSVLGAIGQGAATGAQLAGGWGALGGAVVGLGTGLAGVFTGDAKARKEASRLNTEGMIANNNFINKFEHNAKNIAMNSKNEALLNMAAYGGPISTGDFSNNVRFITEGGSHEENPYQGVQQGIAPDGKPNVVEEGEVIYNDYVYSRRLKVPKKYYDILGLKGSKEYTFADAAEILQKESEERPNDPISKRNLDAMFARLQGSQEELKAKRDAMKMKREFEKLSPEEQAYMLQAMSQPQQAVPVQAQYAAEGGHLFDYGGMPFIYTSGAGGTSYGPREQYTKMPYMTTLIDLGDPSPPQEQQFDVYTQMALKRIKEDHDVSNDAQFLLKGFQGHGSIAYEYPKSVKLPYYYKLTPEGTVQISALESYVPVDNSLRIYSKNKPSKYETAQSFIDNGVASNIIRNYHNNGGTTPIPPSFSQYMQFAGIGGVAQPLDNSVNSGMQSEQETALKTPDISDGYRFLNPNYHSPVLDLKVGRPPLPTVTGVTPSETPSETSTSNTTNNSYAQALRAMPVLGSAIGALSAAFDKPNYSNIQRAENKFLQIPTVSAKPIGDKMSYTPLDTNYMMTQIGNQNIGTRRALIESGANSPSALLASNYKGTTAMGQALRDAQLYELEQKAKVADFNRGTNTFNSESDFKSQIYNQQRANQIANAFLETGKLRDAELAATQGIKSAAYSNLFTNLGNLGKDRLARDQVQALIDSGAYYTISDAMAKAPYQSGGKLKNKKGGKHA